MLNTGSSCEVCDLPNPLMFSTSSSEEEEPLDLWECRHCHVPNEQINKRCIACERTRS